MAIQYVQGDATAPVGKGNMVIAHICNDAGKWGRGFVLALSRRWPEPEAKYRAWYREYQGRNSLFPEFRLGSVRYVEVKNSSNGTLWVANMIAQRDVRSALNPHPIRYDALSTTLSKVADFARRHNASVHMPRLGSGLAGGDWGRIEKIILETIDAQGIPVTVYEL